MVIPTAKFVNNLAVGITIATYVFGADFRTKNISCYGYSNSQIVNKFLDFLYCKIVECAMFSIVHTFTQEDSRSDRQQTANTHQ